MFLKVPLLIHRFPLKPMEQINYPRKHIFERFNRSQLEFSPRRTRNNEKETTLPKVSLLFHSVYTETDTLKYKYRGKPIFLTLRSKAVPICSTPKNARKE